jgi:hypothetical protein
MSNGLNVSVNRFQVFSRFLVVKPPLQKHAPSPGFFAHAEIAAAKGMPACADLFVDSL